MESLINYRVLNKLPLPRFVLKLQEFNTTLTRKEILNLAKTIPARFKQLSDKEQGQFIKFIFNQKAGRDSSNDLAVAFNLAGLTSEKEWKNWLIKTNGPKHLKFQQVKNKNDNGIWRLFFSY